MRAIKTNTMKDLLDKVARKPITMYQNETVEELLLLWQNSGIQPVGVLDSSHKIIAVIDEKSFLSYTCSSTFKGDLSLPIGQLKSAAFSRVTVDTPTHTAWYLPGDIFAIIGEDEKLLGIVTKPELLLCLYSEAKIMQKELDAILKSAPTGIVVIDKEGKIIMFNPAAEQMTRRKHSEAIGRHLADVIIPQGLLDVVKTGKSRLGERLYIPFSQGPRIYITNRSPIIENNEIIGAVGVFQDVTESEFLNKELSLVKEINRELTSVIESSYDGILITDYHGNIFKINKAFTRLTGLEESQIKGRLLQEILPEGNNINSTLKTVIKTKQSKTIAEISPLGNRLLITANPVIDESGQVSRIVFNIRDLSEIDQLKRELQETRSLNLRYKTELRRLHQRGDRDDIVITSNSPEMQKVINLCARVAQVDVTVLLLGESGVGKDVLANFIHNCSPRCSGPFIKINCGAIPEPLLESELFGYERGAFTGANKEGKAGIIELAENGTILLDEVGDIPLSLQVKLLRVLQHKEFTRVGGTITRKVNVRFLAATNRDLEQMVAQGKFREDLYFRLNVVSVKIPPLRSRKEDLPQLVSYFLRKCAQKYNIEKKLAPEIIKIFYEFDWPGNIRQLENVIESLYVTSSGTVITLDCLPDYLFNKKQEAIYKKQPTFQNLPYDMSFCDNIPRLKEAVISFENQIIKRAIEQFGSTYKAAEALGINQSTLIRKMVRFRKIHKAEEPKAPAQKL